VNKITKEVLILGLFAIGFFVSIIGTGYYFSQLPKVYRAYLLIDGTTVECSEVNYRSGSLFDCKDEINHLNNTNFKQLN
jgi:hypothetical protein